MASSNLNPELVASLVAAVQEARDEQDPTIRFLAHGGSIHDLQRHAALHAVEAALRLGRADLLTTAKNEARDKEVRKAASAAIHRLRSMGQKVEETRTAQSWSLKAEEAPAYPPLAVLGMPDRDGTFAFVAVATGANETVAFGGVAGGVSGFRDVEHTHLSRSARREILADLRRDEAMTELPFHAALQILEKAFALGGSRPHEWEHLLIHLDEGTKTSARLLPLFKEALEKPHPDVLAQIVPLLEGPDAIVLLPDTGPLMEAALEVFSAAASPLELSDESRQERIDAAIDKAADAIVTGFRRGTWALALEAAAVVASTRGLEDLVEPARHTALALEQGWPGRSIPYVRELAGNLLKDMIGNANDPSLLGAEDDDFEGDDGDDDFEGDDGDDDLQGSR